jgi:hypothetical protein
LPLIGKEIRRHCRLSEFLELPCVQGFEPPIRELGRLLVALDQRALDLPLHVRVLGRQRRRCRS